MERELQFACYLRTEVRVPFAGHLSLEIRGVMKTLQCLSVIFAVLLFGQITFAQNDSAILRGTVYDLSNQGIPKVKIKARNKNAEFFESVANLSGDYSISLKPGEYELEFYAEGFILTKIRGYKVGLNEKLQLNVTLYIQQITEHPPILSAEKDLVSNVGKDENSQKSALTGNIYDAYGALISKIKVTAINERGEKFETFTSEEGSYKLILPYTKYDLSSASNFKMAKYEIVVDGTNIGFQKYRIKDFNFVPAFDGKMRLDFALDTLNPEPCGYGGDACLEQTPIEIEKTEIKISDKILQKPLESLPKKQNKNKRKNKNK